VEALECRIRNATNQNPTEEELGIDTDGIEVKFIMAHGTITQLNEPLATNKEVGKWIERSALRSNSFINGICHHNCSELAILAIAFRHSDK